MRYDCGIDQSEDSVHFVKGNVYKVSAFETHIGWGKENFLVYIYFGVIQLLYCGVYYVYGCVLVMRLNTTKQGTRS